MADESVGAERQWFYAAGQEQRGPVPESALPGLIANADIGPSSLVWSEGMSEWTPARAALPGAMIPQSWADALPRSPTSASYGTPTPPPTGQQGYGGAGGAGYYHPTGFVDAFTTVFSRYVQFSGRARRAEYWWWTLFVVLGSIGLSIIDGLIFGFDPTDLAILSPLFSLATFIPSLAVAFRRIHDTGKTAWWLLLMFIPLIGTIILLVWFCRRGDAHDNAYGPA
ncbi:MAG: DUF805 domain-containing protein [Devosiaceae bacterium]|nr:DUF805 domain-containing protein [Devosiaceae bacterium MH13]